MECGTACSSASSGEIAGEYLRKGSSATPPSKANCATTSTPPGRKKSTTDIVANEMQMLGGRGEGGVVVVWRLRR